jgi:hypothetical protein
MKGRRELGVHLALLAIATCVAGALWTRDKEPKALVSADVSVWSGRADDVERIGYETKTRKVALEAKKDAAGRYFVGTIERDAPSGGPDAGAPPGAPRSTQALLSVGAAGKLAELVAPLKAFRAVGRVEGDRAAEFGLAEPEGTLTVVVRGAEKKLLVGGPTPGGADRYAREPSTGEVYVIKGDIVRDLDAADARLVERDLHEWKDAEVTAAKLVAGGKSRELVRGGAEGKRFWADAAAADKNDETLGNYMTKLDRVRPNEYPAAAPTGTQDVVRVEYRGAGGPLGWVELVKASPAGGGKAEYFLRSERTRSFARVTASLAEQVEQDLAGVLK